MKKKIKPLFNFGTSTDPSVDVTVVQLLVQNQKQTVVLNKWSNFFGIRPRRGLKVFLCKFWPAIFVQIGNFKGVSFIDHITKVTKKTFDGIRYEF